MNDNISSKKKFNVSSVFDELGVTKFTWTVVLMVGIGMFLSGYGYMVISYTSTQIMATFFGPEGNDVLKGAMVSYTTIGLVIGTFLSGMLADKLGRKKVIIISVSMFSILALPCALAQSYTFFAVSRVLCGFFLGMINSAALPMATECTPTKQRSFFTTFIMAFMVFGWIIAAVIPSALVTQTVDALAGVGLSEGWRLCYFVALIGLVFVVFFWRMVPESAHWYISHGQADGAAVALKTAVERSGKKTSFDITAENILVPPVAVKRSPVEVWKPKYLRITIGCVLLYSAGTFTIYGINAWLPSLMLEASGGDVSASYLLAMSQNCAAVVANCSTGAMSEVLGRKRNLVVGWIAAAIAVFVTSRVVTMPAETSFWPYLICFICLGFFMNFAQTGIQPMLTEGYPTELRSTGVATTNTIAKFVGIFSPIVLGALKGLGWSFSSLILVLMIPLALGVVTALTLPAGYKGKTIDDVAVETSAAAEARA